MDFSWFILLMSAAIFTSMVLLVVICLDCRNKGSIPQTDSEEYMQPGFRVIHPSSHSLSSDWPAARSLLSGSISAAQPTTPSNPIIITLSPDPHLRGSNSTKPQRRPHTPTGETESNSSYVNPEPDHEIDDEPGYIEVLPDEHAPNESKGITPEIHSRSSTPSSDHNYENIEAKTPNAEDDDDDDDDEEESSNYENVQPGQLLCAAEPTLRHSGSAQSSEDEYEDNYVNQPMGLVNNL